MVLAYFDVFALPKLVCCVTGGPKHTTSIILIHQICVLFDDKLFENITEPYNVAAVY